MREYKLIRSKRKTLAIQITNDLQVLVRAPLRLPQKTIAEFVSSNSEWIEKALLKQSVYLEKYPEPTALEIQKFKQEAKAYIPEKVAYYSRLMALYPVAVKINSAKTRFGSCSHKNSLNFSCFLMRYPKEAVDYVIVHELAHIAYKNHSKDFYKLIESVLPDYKRRKSLLKAL